MEHSLKSEVKPLKFGTDGIRGRADEFPFTNEALVRLGWAIAQWINKTYGSVGSVGSGTTQKKTTQTNKILTRILIGTDTRESCTRIKQALVSGLQLLKNETSREISHAEIIDHGITDIDIEIIDAGVIPTPAIYKLIKTEPDFDIGIVISASHNPYHDNGIKLFQEKTGKLTPEDEHIICDFFTKYPGTQTDISIETNPETILEKKLSTNKTIIWEQARDSYIKAVTERFTPDFLLGYTIVLDCAHGATYNVAQSIFNKLGASVITLAVEPDGTNINNSCGSLHPENLQKAVVAHNAHVGFAFDGDGDRVIAVDKHGTIKDGDDILALLLELPEYKNLDRVVGTVMTNNGFEESLVRKNKLLLRTPVGDKYIAACLDTEKLLLGGENSGHIIMKDYLATGDGIFVALKVLESMIINKNWLLKTFNKHAQILINLPITTKQDLAQEPCVSIILQHERDLHDGRVLVRYSGTENVLRVMAEGPNYEQTHACARLLAQELQEVLNTEQ